VELHIKGSSQRLEKVQDELQFIVGSDIEQNTALGEYMDHKQFN